MKLILECKAQQDKTASVLGGAASLAPLVDEKYWAYRVRVSRKQAVLGFPKFGTIGIGFAVEEDWNTNLPYTCHTNEIYAHTEHNRLGVRPSLCLQAIKMIQEAAAKARP